VANAAAVNPFTPDLIATDMMNKLHNLIPSPSTFLPHQSLNANPSLNAGNRNVFK
jgi:hypothetical protein